MNKRNLKNSELDSIGKKLIERGSLPTTEIDKIVSNDSLFSLVSFRIAATGKMPESKGLTVLPASLFIRRNAVAFGGIAVMLTAAIAAVSLLKSNKVLVATEAVSVPVEKSAGARPDNLPPQVVGRNPSPDRAPDRDLRFKKAVVKQVSNSGYRRPQRIGDKEPDPDFYAISYAGDPAETSSGGRIIRVDLKRSSLFAMGVNLSLENDDEVVKADLLIGSDGVTRAIRVIK